MYQVQHHRMRTAISGQLLVVFFVVCKEKEKGKTTSLTVPAIFHTFSISPDKVSMCLTGEADPCPKACWSHLCPKRPQPNS